MASSDVDIYTAWSFLEMGDATRGLEFGQRALAKARAAENWDCICGGYLCVGFNHLAAQHLTPAQEAFTKAIAQSKITGTEVFENMGRAGLAFSRIYQGQESAIADLAAEYEHALATNQPMARAMIAQGLAQVSAERGDITRAITVLEQEAEYLRESGMRPTFVRTLMLLGELYERQGHPEHARKVRKQANEHTLSKNSEYEQQH
jgi:tetratricopeptide (TPR) repeat protein